MNSIKIIKAATALVCSCALFICCQKNNSSSPSAKKIEPDSASGGAVLTLNGAGLSGMRTITFDNGNVPAAFNPTFNTDENIVFRVPDTANGGAQNIVFTNGAGKSVSVPFRVIALVTITGASNYNFTSGSQVTITGNNLGDVSNVTFTGTSTAVTIVSKSKKELVLKMPSTTLNRAKLDITNSSGTVTTSQEFVNMENAFIIFDDKYENGFQDASWGDAGVINTSVSKDGTASVAKKFATGQWHQLGFGWTDYDASKGWTYLSFWIKGASVDYSLWISTNASTGGFASFNDYDKINVPANVWTYFKIPVSQLKLWSTAPSWNQLGLRIQGPNNQDETFYMDDVMFVK